MTVFIEVTPIEKDGAEATPVTINFGDVRTFHFDQQIGCTILRFFDEERTNLTVRESLESIQKALETQSSFSSARNLGDEGLDSAS